MSFRVGQGYDIHAFGDDAARPLVLGGVSLPGPGLAGHSDADVVAHACADALLGAAGLGDLGQWFADTDERWAGADSLDLLGAVVDMVRAEGWAVGNVDLTVLAEVPRLAPHRQTMEQNLAGIVGAPVSIKATTAEGLGPVGRREGIACMAVALIETAAETAGDSTGKQA